MWSFHTLADGFCVHSRLYLKLELEPSRESITQYFDQIRRAFPSLRQIRRREDGALLLEEDERAGAGRRSVRVDASSIRFSVHDAPDAAGVGAFAERVLATAPAFLTLCELDYDYQEVSFAFDLEYRGNHDQLVATTLFPDSPIVSALGEGGARVIDCQPFLGVALGDECETQMFIEIKGRTSMFEVRTGEYETTPLSVYVTARRYRGAQSFDLVKTQRELLRLVERYTSERVAPLVVQPLAAAIASGR